MKWNYRVLHEEINNNMGKSESVRIIEVYYKDNGSFDGWVDCTDTILNIVSLPLEDGENPKEERNYVYESLKGTAQHVLDAFKLPMVALDENGKLYEIDDQSIGKDKL